MQDNHPEISLYDVGDSVKERVSDYGRPGIIVSKEWSEEKGSWEYGVEAKGFKPMLLTSSWFTSSGDTSAKVADRVAKIREEEAVLGLTESQFSDVRFKKLAGII